MKSFIGTIAAAFLCVACGSGSGAGSASGTVNGASLNVSESIFYTQSVSSGAVTENLLAIALSNATNICNDLINSTPPTGNWGILELVIGGSGTLVAGTYNVVDSNSTTQDPNATLAAAEYLDSSQNEVEASSGTVTITSISDSNVSGSYNVTFTGSDGTSSAGSLSGSFSASHCNYTPPSDQ